MFVRAQRTREDFRQAKTLLSDGASLSAIARTLGIPSATIRNWLRRSEPPRGLWEASYEGWRPGEETRYCYLLGLYLGDGCLVQFPRGAPALTLVLDRRYPGIVDEAIEAIRATLPDSRVSFNPRPGAVGICAHHPAWLEAFPQHGPGRKHTRAIRLVQWQREFTHRHPRALLRGLLHSDGSRVVNRFKTKLPSGRVAEYAYVRYFFTNYSADIRAIFAEHCDLLGIRWTQSSFKNISVAKRDGVAALDAFVGPKQ